MGSEQLITVWTFVAGLIAFVQVFFKSLQQQNVTHKKLKAIIPTSLCLSFTETTNTVIIASSFITSGWQVAFAMALVIGICGGLGSTLSVIVFHKYHKRKLIEY